MHLLHNNHLEEGSSKEDNGPIVKKLTFLRLKGFDTFRSHEISTRAGAIQEQLAHLNLRILIEYSVIEWKELREEWLTGNEWED
ncbi:hypothetical protein J1N35_023581 [Gossypium stocksii]|uniref:Uncharacterized protein n=1 Tax=Gossypium stocksii TaxID=47602 RepID=A0A9D3VIF0_9ROSI|nr:hypothetical protein J1N35_023581 [Gossypium stocksii]